MRPIAVITLCGGAGFVAGALTYGWFAAHTLDARNEMVQTRFAIEQEFRATRAERQGDLLAALHYQWNAVEARSPDWLHEFTMWKAPAPWFAVEFTILDKVMRDADPKGKGRQVAQGIALGHLARLLAANGYKPRAVEQWQRATDLTGQSNSEKMRELIVSLRAQQDSELHRQAEQAVLGPDR